MKSLVLTMSACALLAVMAAYPGAQERSAAPGKEAEVRHDAATAPLANESPAKADPADRATKAGTPSPETAPPVDDDQGVQLFRLQRVDAAACQSRLERMFPAAIKEKQLRILADAHTNELLVHAPPELLILVEGVLRGLDNAETLDRKDRQQNPAGDDQARVAENDAIQVKIFGLKNADASDSRQLLLELYPSEFKDRSRIAADVRTNRLVVRGTPAILDIIEAVLINLDSSEPADKPRGKRFADGQAVNGDTAGWQGARAASPGEKWRRSSQTAEEPDPEVRRIRDDFRQLDRNAAGLAREYRRAQAAAAKTGLSPLEDPSCLKLKEQLQSTVESAFDARQKIQRYELEQLREHLARIGSRLALRERAQEEIVRQRVEELLHPEHNWDPADETRDSLPSTDPAARADNEKIPSPSNGSASQATDIWMTDVVTAKAKVAKAGGLLLLYFRPKPSTSGLKKEAEMVGSALMQKKFKHFVLVAIDTSDPANREMMKEYRIAERPTVVVTDEGGQPQYMTERDVFHDRWDMDTLLQDLTGLARRFQDDQAAPAKDEPAASDTGSQVSETSRRPALAQLLDGGKDPRSALLDAEWAVTAARAALAAAGKSHEFSQSSLKRIAELLKSGAITEKAARDAESKASQDEASLAKAKVDLQRASGQLKLARENLDTQKKLLGLDLADAKLRVEHLAAQEQRARRVFDSKAMSKAEYDEAKLALEQARLQLDRISELIKLYSKPLPGAERPDPDGEKSETPDSQDKSQDKKDGAGAAAKKK